METDMNRKIAAIIDQIQQLETEVPDSRGRRRYLERRLRSSRRAVRRLSAKHPLHA